MLPSGKPFKKRPRQNTLEPVESRTADSNLADNALDSPAPVEGPNKTPEDGWITEDSAYDGYFSEDEDESGEESAATYVALSSGIISPMSSSPVRGSPGISPEQPRTPPRRTMKAGAKKQSDQEQAPLPNASAGNDKELEIPHQINEPKEGKLKIKVRANEGDPVWWVSVLKPIPPHNQDMRDRKFKSTPNTKTSSSTSVNQKNKAIAADPNRGRCFITGQIRLSPGFIQACHIIPQALWRNKAFNHRLSHAWGYRVHLDSHYNLLNLKPDWHYTFDQGFWLLVPTLETIEDMIEKANDQLNPVKPPVNLREEYSKKRFEYFFVSILDDNLNTGPFFRRRHKTGDWILHDFPYTTMPIIRSHAQPQFVAYHAINMYNQIELPQGKHAAMARLQGAYNIYAPNLGLPSDNDYGRKCFQLMDQLLQLWWNPDMPPLPPLVHHRDEI